MCGRTAGFFRSLGGTTTLTQGGAERGVRRHTKKEIGRLKGEIKRIERGHARKITKLHQTPVVDGLHGMTWQAAEILACTWMKKNGHWGAKVSPPGADGGIDIESAISIAQVKHHQSPVGIDEMQRIYGIAQSTKKKALFFAVSGYTAPALQWAKKHRIECYTYPPMTRIKA
jgi:Restriction endonuclease